MLKTFQLEKRYIPEGFDFAPDLIIFNDSSVCNLINPVRYLPRYFSERELAKILFLIFLGCCDIIIIRLFVNIIVMDRFIHKKITI